MLPATPLRLQRRGRRQHLPGPGCRGSCAQTCRACCGDGSGVGRRGGARGVRAAAGRARRLPVLLLASSGRKPERRPAGTCWGRRCRGAAASRAPHPRSWGPPSWPASGCWAARRRRRTRVSFLARPGARARQGTNGLPRRHERRATGQAGSNAERAKGDRAGGSRPRSKQRQAAAAAAAAAHPGGLHPHDGARGRALGLHGGQLGRGGSQGRAVGRGRVAGVVRISPPTRLSTHAGWLRVEPGNAPGAP